MNKNSKKQPKNSNPESIQKKPLVMKKICDDVGSCLKKFWNYVWYDDSLGSWIVNIVLAFIIIKFILYPLMGFLLGTSLPIVAVVSESMEHEVDFDTWWDSVAVCDSMLCSQKNFYNDFNITKDVFLDFPLKNGFKRGDIIFLIGIEPDGVEVGDVIVFNSLKENSYPIIHRVIQINNQFDNLTNQSKFSYVTKGDHNKHIIYTQGYLDENNIEESQLLGKGLIKIPYLGYVKLIVVDVFSFIIQVVKLIL